MIKPPKTPVTAENTYCLQTLDVLEMMDKAPIDEQQPYGYEGEAELQHMRNVIEQTVKTT